MNIFFIYYILGINLATYTVFLFDKKRAIENKYRVSESFLFLLVVLGGNVGAIASMIINRHKIKKFSFIIKYIVANFLFFLILFNYYNKI